MKYWDASMAQQLFRNYANTDNQTVAAFEEFITHAATTAQSIERRIRQVANCAAIHAEGYVKRKAVDCNSSGTRCCCDLAGNLDAATKGGS